MEQEITTYVIDATGRSLGRVASEAAHVLLGKDHASFAKNTVAPVVVEIQNASKLKITEKKREQETYIRYSGYPSGQKSQRLEEVIAKKGYGEVLRKAVYGMLPGNRLRAVRMKNLTIHE